MHDPVALQTRVRVAQLMPVRVALVTLDPVGHWTLAPAVQRMRDLVVHWIHDLEALLMLVRVGQPKHDPGVLAMLGPVGPATHAPVAVGIAQPFVAVKPTTAGCNEAQNLTLFCAHNF